MRGTFNNTCDFFFLIFIIKGYVVLICFKISSANICILITYNLSSYKESDKWFEGYEIV